MKTNSVLFFTILFFCSLNFFNQTKMGKKNSKSNLRLQNTLNSKEEIPEEGCAIIYFKCNFQGNNPITICSNVSNLVNLNLHLNIKSIKLGLNTEIFLFSEIDYEGQNYTLNEDLKCIDNKKNDTQLLRFKNKIKSLMIENVHTKSIPVQNYDQPEKGCIWVYEECNFRGEEREICENTDLTNIQGINFINSISSILLGEKTEIILYKDYNFEGEHLEIKSTMECLSSEENDETVRAFDDNSYSVKILEKKI
jgi:hypothetical protein